MEHPSEFRSPLFPNGAFNKPLEPAAVSAVNAAVVGADDRRLAANLAVLDQAGIFLHALELFWPTHADTNTLRRQSAAFLPAKTLLVTPQLDYADMYMVTLSNFLLIPMIVMINNGNGIDSFAPTAQEQLSVRLDREYSDVSEIKSGLHLLTLVDGWKLRGDTMERVLCLRIFVLGSFRGWPKKPRKFKFVKQNHPSY